MKSSISKLFFITTLLFLSLSIQAQTTEFTYQGRLLDSSLPPTANYDFQFSLWDSLANGTQAGATQTLTGVAVTNGIFTVRLNFGNEFPGSARFLQIDVRPAGGGSYTTLAPRQPMTSAPYAVKAFNAENADNATTATNAMQLDGQSASFYLDATNINAGTLNEARLPAPLTLSGNNAGGHIIRGDNASASDTSTGVSGYATAPTGVTSGVTGQSSSRFGRGVSGYTNDGSGVTFGIFGQSLSTNGFGVYGEAIAGSGETFGVSGNSLSTSGRGVFGQATAPSGNTYGGRFHSFSTSGTGVFGFATASTGSTLGVWGESNSVLGVGVYGLNSAATGQGIGVSGQTTATVGRTFGVLGLTRSDDGIGVLGDAAHLTGSTTGVWGQSGSVNGVGVVGIASASSGQTYGGRFEAFGTSSRAVLGWARATTGATYGVYGLNSSTDPAAWGVYAGGNLGASGFKSFRIDHPDDPSNKYLLHYSTESPEVLNAYSGSIILDDAGQAVVKLPSYFAKINKDPRYTLTAVGAPMPMLHVTEEIDNDALIAGAKAGPGEASPQCSFRIAGGAPGAKVSWRVEALRNDKWMQQRQASVETEKEGIEKGTYQNPEFYGQPKEKSMNYDATRGRKEKENEPKQIPLPTRRP